MVVEFDVEEFRDLVTERGESITWDRAQICPCNDPVSGVRDRACTLCGGVGYTYTAITGIDDYRALVRQVDERKDYAHYGQVYLGDITITTMPDELPIGEGDRITLTARRFRREEIVTCSGDTTDLLHWTPAAELVVVRSLETVYEIDTDVELSSDGEELTWLTTPPDAGVRLTVLYWWTPRYVVVPSMIATRKLIDGVYLPQRVVARLKGREEFRE